MEAIGFPTFGLLLYAKAEFSAGHRLHSEALAASSGRSTGDLLQIFPKPYKAASKAEGLGFGGLGFEFSGFGSS